MKTRPGTEGVKRSLRRCLDVKEGTAKGDTATNQLTELVTILVNETDSTEGEETHAARSGNNTGRSARGPRQEES
ncbi:hypothetical protein E2C01_078950 [Portunus trituberculatus]|uniref:Uncharacterized protein n=1 Tax=Portunus trituberculatus TaxID=210409 RepID=A0A5B7IFQ1_PORTR|nr:hypothetical protein [Portunus trituberculatus]